MSFTRFASLLLLNKFLMIYVGDANDRATILADFDVFYSTWFSDSDDDEVSWINAAFDPFKFRGFLPRARAIKRLRHATRWTLLLPLKLRV